MALEVTHTSTTATISQGVRWWLASRAQAFTETTACTCTGRRQGGMTGLLEETTGGARELHQASGTAGTLASAPGAGLTLCCSLQV